MAAPIKKMISGGQTGVDRAALDVALGLGIPCGGWCPKGRKAEDGMISTLYPLKDTPKTHYKQRTEWNVRDSDGTLILTRGKPTGGTAITMKFAAKYEKPYLVVDLISKPDPKTVLGWLSQNNIQELNLAGPRESGCPGIHDEAAEFLLRTLS